MRHANSIFNFRLEKVRGLIIYTWNASDYTEVMGEKSVFLPTRILSGWRYDFNSWWWGTSRDSGNWNHQNHNDLSLINQLDNTCIYSKPIPEVNRCDWLIHFINPNRGPIFDNFEDGWVGIILTWGHFTCTRRDKNTYGILWNFYGFYLWFRNFLLFMKSGHNLLEGSL